jgi:hypothetical protein
MSQNPTAILLNYLPVLLIVLPILALYVYSISWAAADARDRGKSGLFVGLMVSLVHPWPLGLIVWLVFRPAPSLRL